MPGDVDRLFVCAEGCGRRNFFDFFVGAALSPLALFGKAATTCFMFETNAIPDDLETCQRLLRELMEAYGQLEKVHGELLAISTDMRDSQEKLEQEKAALEETVKE